MSFADFFQNHLFREKIFQEYHQSVKQFESRSGPTFLFGPDLGPNCLQRLKSDNTSKQSVKVGMFFLGGYQQNADRQNIDWP